MKITVLGCNGLYPMDGINSSGYLLSDENFNLVLDMGSGVFSALQKIIAPERVNAVFISHLHFDHISDLGVYNYYLESKAKKGEFSGKIKLLVKNDGSAVYRAIEGLNYFEIEEYGDALKYINGATLEFYQMKHPVLSHAVTVQLGGKTFGYLGDGNVSDNLKRVIALSDLTIAHAPFFKAQADSSKPHASAYEVACIARDLKKRVLISHLMPNCEKKTLNEEIRECAEYCSIVNQGEIYLV
jgi:ribonuclease BN (tRNA processing enzyme)